MKLSSMGEMLSDWRSMFNWFVIMLLSLLCFACAAAPTPKIKERYVWPPPPDVARIEWLGTYNSQNDIDKTPTQSFWAAIAGEDPPFRLLKPVEVKSVPEQNKFFVSDVGRAEVVVFDLDGHEVRTLKVPEKNPMRLPLSIALDSNGAIYVLDRRSSSVYVFDRYEKYQRTISLRKASVTNPIALIIDKKNSLMYVSDAASRKIVVADLNGVFIRSIGSAGDGDGQFNLPVAMAFNSKGKLVVADAFSAKIQIFDEYGGYVSKFGNRGDSPGSFQLIKSLAIDSSDNIYVVDGRAHNVTIFNEHGELLLVMGGYYASAETGKLAPGGFSIPIGVDIDSTDKIFVVDQMNGRVQVFQYFSEEYLRRATPP